MMAVAQEIPEPVPQVGHVIRVDDATIVKPERGRLVPESAYKMRALGRRERIGV